MPAIRGAARPDKVPQPRVCVVILGSGRSGTSVTARILLELGVRLNYNPAQMSDQNPEGAYEDEFIFKTHSEFLDAGHIRRNQLPAGWAATDSARTTGAKLESYVRQEFGSDPLWGFKDPRTSVLLPLWKRIFNRIRVVPRYVVCVRHPAAFVQSMSSNYGIGQNDAELIWLTRTVSALRDTGLDCFILHYERLLADPPRAIRMLAKFALGKAPDPAELKEITARCIKPSLNRAKINSVALINPAIPSLAAALDKCEGAGFARSRLTAALQNCDRILTAFSPLIGNQQREAPTRGPREPSNAAEPQPLQSARNDRTVSPARVVDGRTRTPDVGSRGSAGPSDPRSRESTRPDDEFTLQRARWRQQTEDASKRFMERTELLREQLTEQRVQWHQQAAALAAAHAEEIARFNHWIGELDSAHAEELARLNHRIGELEALSEARGEEATRLGTDLAQAVALAAERADEITRFRDRIGEVETLSTARGEEAARLEADRATAAALAAQRADEIARLDNRLTQQGAHLADSAATHAEETARFSEQIVQISEQIAQREAQLTEMTQQLEQVVEQHRLQSIELKWAAIDREALNVKVASLVALQTANRRPPSPAGQPLSAHRIDFASGERPASPNGGPAPEQQRDAAVVLDGETMRPRQRDAATTGAKKPTSKRDPASAKWTVRSLLRAPRSFLRSWLPTK